MIFLTTILSVIAYCFGSFSSAVVVCKAWGLPDPRESGSKNPGATNVLRLGGKKLAILVLVCDALKGLIPVFIAVQLNISPGLASVVALMAFLGHLFPIFFDFEGGKGVATAFGAMLALSPTLGVMVLFTWLAVAFATRYSSLSALVAAFLAPLYAWIILGQQTILAISIMSILLIFRHHGNIKRLLDGSEPKIGSDS